MIKIKFYSLLRSEFGCSEMEIDVSGIPILELLEIAEKKLGKNIVDQLTDNKDELSKGTIILLNGRNIVHLDKFSTIGRSGDKVDIFPPGGGG